MQVDVTRLKSKQSVIIPEKPWPSGQDTLNLPRPSHLYTELKSLFRIFLPFVQCLVALIHIATPSRAAQFFSAKYAGNGSMCIAADDGNNLDDMVFRTDAEERHQPKAARIYQRYIEQLQAYFNVQAEARLNPVMLVFVTDTKPICNADYNSICLSSCYDYIFRLSLF